MSKIDLLILGLGNPGERYSNTRHNIGFMLADAIANDRGVDFEADKCDAYFAEAKYAGKVIRIVKPTTFMNLSGRVAKYYQNKYSVPSDKIIAITDEYNFPTGRLHLKMGGSDGGHNGIGSIIYELNTEKFYRLRCGIDKKFGMGGLVDYVLADFPSDENDLIDMMKSNGVKSVKHILKVGFQRAMSDINSGKLFEDSELISVNTKIISDK